MLFAKHKPKTTDTAPNATTLKDNRRRGAAPDSTLKLGLTVRPVAPLIKLVGTGWAGPRVGRLGSKELFTKTIKRP